MKEATEQEKKDKRFSMIMSGIVHTSLLVLFLFLVAWRMPDPPPEEYGMELNIGVDETGSGDVDSDLDDTPVETENETPPESEDNTEELQEEPTEETPTEDPVEEPVEEVQDPVEEVQEVVEEVTEPVEEPTEEVVTPTETQETESDVKAEEQKQEQVEEEKKEEEVKPVEEEKKPEPPTPKPKPEINKQALLGSKKSETDSKDPAASSQGKTVDERGQMGKPTGKKNTDGQVPGGADFGVSLSLDGWKWERPPADKDDSQIDGVIKFRIIVDDRGDVVDVIKIPGTTISNNNVVSFYEKQVRKLVFIRTADKNNIADRSVGEITFVIKTN